MNIGDLVWCVYNDYFLPEYGIIIKVHTYQFANNESDKHYEVLVGADLHTLCENEIFKDHLDALDHQLNQLRKHLIPNQ